MANHVYTQLDIEFINQQDTAKFSEWIGHTPPVKNTTFGERIETCCNIMLDNLYPDKENTNAYYIENLGAKWIYFDDVDQSETTMHISWTTAWDFPDKLFWKLSDFLRIEYPGAKIQGTFEDEGFGFVGACASNQQSRNIEYFNPDEEFFEGAEYKDEDDCFTDDFYNDIISKKQELLDTCINDIIPTI